MGYNFKAKPTYYNNRLYRSRLEARYAAFFDMMGWSFEYEPESFPTWSPDFVLNDFDELFLEIKPYALWSDDLISKIRPYSKDNRCGLVGDAIIAEENAFYLGKYFNQDHNDHIILKDIICQYRHLNRKAVDKCWIEAANKVMYLKPN
jgi:hypothetical protein